MKILGLLLTVGAAAALAAGQEPFQLQTYQPSTSFQSSSATASASTSSPSTWSTKNWLDRSAYMGYLGFGFSEPVGTTHNRLNTGWNFVAGFGPRLGRYFSLPVDFTYQHNSAAHFLQTGGSVPISGNMRLWSLSLNPRVDVPISHMVDWYATVGYGLYNRREQITQTTVVTGVFCDPWWGFCSVAPVAGNAIVGEHSVYNGGFNFGTGFAFGPPHAKFFAEVRYDYMYTSPVRTEMLPVTFGVRF